MAKNARSIKLNSEIEAELEIMLTLGVEKAPISAATLYARLIAKGVLQGAISTLTSRKDMIAEYAFQQMAASGIEIESKPKYGTVEYYKARNQTLIAEVSELKRQLSEQTAAVAEIIRRVESQTPIKVEDLILPIVIKPMDDVPY